MRRCSQRAVQPVGRGGPAQHRAGGDQPTSSRQVRRGPKKRCAAPNGVLMSRKLRRAGQHTASVAHESTTRSPRVFEHRRTCRYSVRTCWGGGDSEAALDASLATIARSCPTCWTKPPMVWAGDRNRRSDAGDGGTEACARTRTTQAIFRRPLLAASRLDAARAGVTAPGIRQRSANRQAAACLQALLDNAARAVDEA